jgi:hypothetical protein
MATTGEEKMHIQITDDAITLPVNHSGMQQMTIPLNGMTPIDALKKEFDALWDLKQSIAWQQMAVSKAVKLLDGEK